MPDVEYCKGGDTYELIKVIEAWGLTYKLSQVLRYIYRAGKKGEDTKDEDLRKAGSYLHRERTGRWPWEEPGQPGQPAPDVRSFQARYFTERWRCSVCGGS